MHQLGFRRYEIKHLGKYSNFAGGVMISSSKMAVNTTTAGGNDPTQTKYFHVARVVINGSYNRLLLSLITLLQEQHLRWVSLKDMFILHPLVLISIRIRASLSKDKSLLIYRYKVVKATSLPERFGIYTFGYRIMVLHM